MSADLHPASFASQRTTRWLGATYYFEEEVDSTNTFADQLARHEAPEGTVVVADSQTSGRGRLQRTWNSPAGLNLYFSVLLRPRWEIGSRPPVSLAAGLAAAEAVEQLLGETPVLKWPNDVLLQGRKLAGILVEGAATGGRLSHMILGIGINVNQTAFPPPLDRQAVSLQQAAGRPFDRGQVLATVLQYLEQRIDMLESDLAPSILDHWKEYAPWLGGPIVATQGDAKLEGVALDLDPSGALQMEDAAGRRHTIVAGDAFPATVAAASPRKEDA